MPSDDHTDGTEAGARGGVDRRSVLKALGAGGLAFAGGRPVAAGPPGDTVEIASTKRGRPDGNDEVLRTRVVPRKWYDHQMKVRRVNERLTEQLIDVPGVRSVGITAHGGTIGNYQKQAIKVRLAGESVDRQVPSQAEGVPIVVERSAPPARPQSDDSCSNANYYDSYYSPIQGGIVIESSSTALDNCSGFGTACCRVEYGGAGEYFLSASHVWGCTTTDHTGDPVYQHGAKMGSIKNDWKSHDLVLIEPRGVRSYSNQVVDDPDPIVGYETQSEVSALCSSGSSVQKRGVNSGAGTATVVDYGETLNGCGYTTHDVIVYNTWTHGDGDSGGPYFVNDGSYNSLVGMHSWGQNIGNETRGAAAYAMRSTHLVYPT